jgi:hypothetical protein
MSLLAFHLFFTSLRTTPEFLMQLVRDRWSIEGWQWIIYTQLHEDPHSAHGSDGAAAAEIETMLRLLISPGLYC